MTSKMTALAPYKYLNRKALNTGLSGKVDVKENVCLTSRNVQIGSIPQEHHQTASNVPQEDPDYYWTLHRTIY
ncbi:unnamed protein product [Leptidea sinapis]|uniref:Uncharacterized protein n=1 Tax=Leptidea sinapis TaxID=189913 RepID=A0A5E4PRX1_9NEOP|nr:unnamed protein product [Leptidea sinapis]